MKHRIFQAEHWSLLGTEGLRRPFPRWSPNYWKAWKRLSRPFFTCRKANSLQSRRYFLGLIWARSGKESKNVLFVLRARLVLQVRSPQKRKPILSSLITTALSPLRWEGAGANFLRVPFIPGSRPISLLDTNASYYLALSHKDWELRNSRIWLTDGGLDFPI